MGKSRRPSRARVVRIMTERERVGKGAAVRAELVKVADHELALYPNLAWGHLLYVDGDVRIACRARPHATVYRSRMIRNGVADCG